MQWFQHVSVPCNVMTWKHREVLYTVHLCWGHWLDTYIHQFVISYSLKTLCGNSMIEAHYCILELEMDEHPE